MVAFQLRPHPFPPRSLQARKHERADRSRAAAPSARLDRAVRLPPAAPTRAVAELGFFREVLADATDGLAGALRVAFTVALLAGLLVAAILLN